MNKKTNNFYADETGAAALLTILIVSASALIISFSAAFMGLGELEMGYVNQRGAEAFSAADGCMEEALRRIKIDSGYNGGSLVLDSGSCIIEVAFDGSNRTISATGAVDEYNKKIEAEITITGNIITVNSWAEKYD